MSTSKWWVVTKRHLLLSLLNIFWSNQMKNILIWGLVILVLTILCSSRWISLRDIYICTILMVLTHPRGERQSSIPEVLILCRATTSCTKVLATILWGEIRILSAALCDRILRRQYQHTSYIQIGDCTPYWSTYYLCSIFNGCSVVIFLLMIKN